MIVTAAHVDRQNQRWVFERAKSKGKRMRQVVYLNDEAMAITARAMLKYPEGPLFRNIRGVPWTTEAVNCACDRLRLKMGRALIPVVTAIIGGGKVETDRPMLETLAHRVAGRSETRLTFVRPSFINAQHFDGDRANTQYRIRTDKAELASPA